MKSKEYYQLAARLILLNTSRTAKKGEIDITASSENTNIPKTISQKTIGGFNSEQIRDLQKSNEKARYLDLNNLKDLTQKEIKDLTIKNFNKAIEYVFDQAQRIIHQGLSVTNIIWYEFIKHIAITVGEGIVQRDAWFRRHDSKKYPYAKLGNLRSIFDQFCEELTKRLQNMPSAEPNKSEWVKETTAWIEYRINLTDHFMTDSCGKVATVMVTFVCILADHSLPIFADKADYLLHAPRRPRDSSQDAQMDKQFERWKNYYASKFETINDETKIESESKLEIQFKLIEADKDYDYKRYALDNLAIISNTSKKGKPSASGYIGKETHLQQTSSIEIQSLIIAKFMDLITTFQSGIKNKQTVENLENLIYKVVIQLNEKNLKISQNACPQDLLRDQDGNWPNSPCKELSENFKKFLNEIADRIKNRHKLNPIITLALIYYRIFLQHQFFKDGNKRIALALTTYVCMGFHIELPRFTESVKYTCYYNKEKITTDDIHQDPQFLQWLYFYKTLFRESISKEKNLREDKNEFVDGWDVTFEKTLDERFTIFNQKVCSRDFQTIERMRKATGFELKKLVVFRPSRMLLHEIIIYSKTNFKFNDSKKYEIFMLRIIEFFPVKLTEQLNSLENEFEENKRYFENYLNYVVEDYFHAANVDVDLQKRIKKFSDCIQKRIKDGKCNIPLSKSKSLMVELIVDDILRDLYIVKIRKVVEEIFITNNNFESQNLAKMKNFQRLAWAIVGGPASGKSSLKKSMQIAQPEEGYCSVNPDDFKRLLAIDDISEKNSSYAALVHEESSYISDQIMLRLNEMIKADNAPHILLDTVTSSDEKMNIIGYGGASIYLQIANCKVEGSDGAINRAFLRAQNDNSTNEDKNRYVPTEAILSGHKKESELLPRTIQKFKVNLRLFDTRQKQPLLAAVIDGHNKQLKIYEPQSFYHFVKKKFIYVKAAFEDQVYHEDITGKEIAKEFLDYLNSQVELIFMYGEEIPNPNIEKLKKQKQVLKEKQKESESEDKASNSDEINNIKKQIRQLKKENTFAIFNAKLGIVCNDFSSFSKVFDVPNQLEVAQEFLLCFIKPIINNDANKQELPQNIPFYLYEKGQCVLKKDQQTNFELIYDRGILEWLCPVIFRELIPHPGLRESFRDALIPIMGRIQEFMSNQNNVQELHTTFEPLKQLFENPNVTSHFVNIASAFFNPFSRVSEDLTPFLTSLRDSSPLSPHNELEYTPEDDESIPDLVDFNTDKHKNSNNPIGSTSTPAASHVDLSEQKEGPTSTPSSLNPNSSIISTAHNATLFSSRSSSLPQAAEYKELRPK